MYYCASSVPAYVANQSNLELHNLSLSAFDFDNLHLLPLAFFI